MKFRFSLYGFLKNQTYFEPFIILAFREKGLSFFQIGLLIGFREVCINLFEVPSGAVADLYGRRRAMVFSFSAYIVSFLIFGLAASLAALFAAMLAFAIGEAFRSGTHKAMIFDWLRERGREKERIRFYGFTRSWSKMGSALAVLISSGFVFSGTSYSDIFLLTAIPYLLGIVNFFGYPASLDGERNESTGMAPVFSHLRKALYQTLQFPPLRRIVGESMGYEGSYKVTKDYIQPVIKQVALSFTVLAFLEEQQRVAILVGSVYFSLHLLSSLASRGGYRLKEAAGSEERAAQLIWLWTFGLYAVLVLGLWMDYLAVVIAAFIGLAVAQNFWRPILISRIDTHGLPEAGATILSIEAQAKSFFAMCFAPAVGFAVDRFGLVPVGVAGFLVVLLYTFRGFLYPGEKVCRTVPQPK